MMFMCKKLIFPSLPAITFTISKYISTNKETFFYWFTLLKGVYRWMYIYLVPLGHIFLNAVTQAMNVTEKWWYSLIWWPSTAASCSPSCVQFCYTMRDLVCSLVVSYATSPEVNDMFRFAFWLCLIVLVKHHVAIQWKSWKYRNYHCWEFCSIQFIMKNPPSWQCYCKRIRELD